MKTKVILIGLDGGTFSILDPLMEEGVMPHLRTLTSKGCRGELLSTALHVTPPAWTSLITGVGPGTHGVMDFVRPVITGEGIYVRLVDSRDICCETIWSIASRQDCRVISLNFPVMFPPQAVFRSLSERRTPGCLVAGLISARHIRRAMYPQELYEQLKRLDGFDPKELAWDMEREEKCVRDLRREEYEDWIQFHIRRERQWFNILRYLMHSEPAELCAILFDGVDKLQHLCWHVLDPQLLCKAPSSWERRIRGLCLDYFRQLDTYIGEIVQMGGPDARVFLCSDHGFGPSRLVFYLNVWLQQHGYLEWGVQNPPEDADAMFTARRSTQLFDWSKTLAYAVTPSSNGINIVISKGPGQFGVPSAQYESFRKELIASLLAFTDPVSGEAVLRRVMTREEAFPGKQMELAPDLTVVLADYGFISVANAASPLKRRPECKGMHRPEGVLVAAGQGIRQGIGLPQLSILDVCPALLYSLNLAIPQDLEGRFPAEIFEPSQIKAAPPRPEKPATAVDNERPEGSDASLSREEEAAVLAALEKLGYL